MFTLKKPDPARARAYRFAFHMAWPAVVESFFVSFAGLVDSLMVSSLGSSSVAAVGLTTQPKFISLCFFLALNVAISALVARRRGQQDQRGANRVLLTAFIITLVVGILISALCVAGAETIMGWAGANEDTLASSTLYFRIISGGMIFNVMFLAINAAQRGSGNTRIAMYTNVTGNLVNIVGNYFLINGHFGFPALGIQGAAMATVLGTIVAFNLIMQGIQDVGPVKASMLAATEPLSATVFSALWLGTAFSVTDLIGFACIVSTIFLLAKTD